MDTKFKVNDKIEIIATNEKGTIKEIVSHLGKGSNLYLVNINGRDVMVSEKELKRVENFNVKNVNLNVITSKIEFEDKVNGIINELGLVVGKDEETVVKNACKVQRYIATNLDKKKNISFSSNDKYFNELYDALIYGRRDYIANTTLFYYLMKKMGATVYSVALTDEDNQFYVANLLLIGRKYYYFDPSLEITIYKESYDKDFILCCAGMGEARFSKFFKALSLLDVDMSLKDYKVPNNISLEDYRIENWV